MGGIINILRETGDMSATAPPDPNGERYTGPDVKPDGNLICPICGKPYDECTCEKDTLRSPDNAIDNPLLARMGNVPQKEAYMDPLDELNGLLLEEYLGSPSVGGTEKPVTTQEAVPDGITPGHRSFSEQFYDYMKRHGDDIDRKPSDGPLKPSNNKMRAFYEDHFHTKIIR